MSPCLRGTPDCYFSHSPISSSFHISIRELVSWLPSRPGYCAGSLLYISATVSHSVSISTRSLPLSLWISALRPLPWVSYYLSLSQSLFLSPCSIVCFSIGISTSGLHSGYMFHPVPLSGCLSLWISASLSLCYCLLVSSLSIWFSSSLCE